MKTKIHLRNQDVWQFGTIIRKLGQYHYIVELDIGRTLKQHINQLIANLVPKIKVYATPLAPQHRMGVPFTIESGSFQPPPTPQSSVRGPDI